MKIRIYKKGRNEVLFEIAYVVLIFQIALQSSSIQIISKIFNYIDDVIAVCCLLYVTLSLLAKKKCEKSDRRILYIYLLFVVTGIVGTLRLRIQPFSIWGLDLFTCSKFIVGYLSMRICSSRVNKDFLKKSVLSVTRFMVLIYFVFAIHDEFMSPFFGIFDHRMFGKSIELFYPHPTYLAAACIVFLLILAVTCDRGNNYIYMIMSSVIIIFTFRAKAIAFVAVFWGLYLMIEVWKIKNKLIYATVSLLLAGYLAYDQFATYFMSKTWSARAVLFADAASIAKKYFPFGAGFASFGTNMSVVSYSPIYYQLGYNQIDGMSKNTAAYLNDGFWQACLAQFGVLGVVAFIILILFLLKKTMQYRISDVGAMRYFSMLSLNVYLIIASIGELAYFAPYALLYFIVLGIIFDENDKIVSENRRC
ncbi:hypothetical protein [Blautia marasmi]|uniref:hypothetical protein n=1 Tax=Blautia marasmi TaxID=1917868 RepID=UPI000CF1D8B8|nr:hypothetical protein [Blautia marasmi]